jgi:outer membrane protein TolC
MPLPIFDQNQAQIAKAIFAYQQTEKNLDALNLALIHDVSSAIEQAAARHEVEARPPR